MPVYLGIDEAGYGPMFGPMTVACAVFRVPTITNLWDTWHTGVARDLKHADHQGTVAIADSKKLTGRKRLGLKPLELPCLAFAQLAHQLDPNTPTSDADWTAALKPGNDCAPPAWYLDQPNPLPADATPGELAITHSLLQRTLADADATCLGLRAAVLFEDRFNQLVRATHNKATVNFTCVTRHLFRAFEAFGSEHVFAAVDRQGGRKDYRAALQQAFPEATLTQGTVTDDHSGYRLERGDRRMTVVFETQAETKHLPTALASMTAKWTRELWMRRFNAWWAQHLPDLKPTKGYGTDGNRWWRDVTAHLKKLGINPRDLRRESPGR